MKNVIEFIKELRKKPYGKAVFFFGFYLIFFIVIFIILGFGGTNSREKQNEEEATFAYNIKREEEHIDFNKTSREVFNLIRGLCPIPSANVILDGNEMKVYSSTISNKNYSGKCGEIVDVTKEGIVVKTLDGAVCLTEIKPFGKKRMTSSSYVNGVGSKNLLGKVFE